MNASPLRDRMHRLAPGIAAGTSLGISDVLAKILLVGGVDVVSMLSFRSVVGLAFVASWLHFGRRPAATAQVRVISMIVGIIFAGLIFCLFKAIETIDVPTAILSYFTYPLLTGLTAAFAGLEPLRWKAMLCAIVAFCGLDIADRRASCGVRRGGSRLCHRRCRLPHSGFAGDARLSRRRRRTPNHLVFDAVVDGHLRGGVFCPTRMDPAALGFGLDLSRDA